MGGKITVTQAGVEDCKLIHELALRVFPHTYRCILTEGQIEYMMEWMCAPENIRRQMQDGHVYYIAYDAVGPVGYVSVLFIWRKSMCCPNISMRIAAVSCSVRFWLMSKRCIRPPAPWN